jgi:hypothetical protein
VYFGGTSGLSTGVYQYWHTGKFTTFEGWVGGEVVGAGDFNGDGDDDLITVDFVTGNNVMCIEGTPATGLSFAGGFRLVP